MATHEMHSSVAGLGGVLAAVLSYIHNHSICWALLHFLTGWIYVFYALLTRTPLANLIK